MKIIRKQGQIDLKTAYQNKVKLTDRGEAEGDEETGPDGDGDQRVAVPVVTKPEFNNCWASDIFLQIKPFKGKK